MNIQQALTLYFKNSILKTSSQSRYRHITKELIQYFGSSLNNLTQEKIHAYKNCLLTKNKPSTIRVKLAVLKALLKIAQSQGKAQNIIIPQVKGDSGRTRTLSLEEQHQLLQWCQLNSPSLGLVIAILLSTGLRVSEFLKMEPSWVSETCITIPWFVSKNSTQGKVYLTQKTYALVNKWLKHPFKPQYMTLYRLWGRACKAVGIKDLRIHDLRHTFCSRLANKGASPHIIKTLARHKSLTSTERYIHPEINNTVLEMLE